MTNPGRHRLMRTGALVAAAAIAFGTATVLPSLADDSTTITILNINDFHGRIGLDTAGGGVNTVRFAGTIEELRDQYGPASTLLLSAGDNVGASLFASAIAQDDPTLAVLAALGLDASAVGNHELDQGIEDLVNRIAPTGGFPYLGANVYEAGTFDPVLPEYAIFEVAGHRVGVIGAVTQETGSLVNPAGVSSVEFGDPVDAVNRVAIQLSNGEEADGEADVLIAEYHEGAPVGADQGGTLASNVAQSPVFAKIVEDTVPQVDVLFTAHTHQAYVWQAPVPGEPGVTRPVVQTGSYAQHVGVVRLSVDPAGNVTAATAEDVDPTATPTDELVARFPSVAEVDRITAAALENATEIGGRQVGSITGDVTTAYAGGSYGPGGYQGGERDDRSRESTLGALVADALHEALVDPARGGADFAAVNPGGLRAELLMQSGAPAGTVTYAEANSVLPFGNDLWTTTLSGSGVKALLEQQWQRDEHGDVPSRAYLALALSSNVSYTYDESRAEGDRVTSITIDDVPVDPAGSYRLGTWAFLISGGDNFRAAGQGTDARDSGLLDRDAWIGYLQAHPDLAPNFAKAGVSVSGLPASVAPGDRMTFSISDLDLTSLGAPATTSLDVAWTDSAAFAAPTIDAGDAPHYAVTVTVPDDALAASVIVVTAHPSGTTARIPIAVEGGAAAPPPGASTLSGMDWIWLAAIGLTGGIVILVVIATIAAFAGRPQR